MKNERKCAEILSTGDEIRSGIITDTNSAYISNLLETNGIKVVRHTCVGDNLAILASVICEIGNRTDIAIVSGGLGPTTDDLTAKAAAKAANVKMKLSEKALESLRSFYKKINFSLTKSSLKQALLPEGSECIVNEKGSAPGFSLIIGKCTFFFIPGVPNEAKYMLTRKVIPIFRKKSLSSIFYNKIKTLMVFGLSESKLAEKLSDFGENFSEIKIGTYIKFPQIQLRFYTKETNCKNTYIYQVNEAVKWVTDRIGNTIVSKKGESIERVVGNMLKIKKATLAVAESCTGGLVSHQLTNIPDSSKYFLLSTITYSDSSKINILGVHPETIRNHGSVHINTAVEMAVGIRKKANSTYGLSLTGIAGPIKDFSKKSVGRICVGVSSSSRSYALKFNSFSKDRLKNKKIFATLALDVLRKELLNFPEKNQTSP